MIDPIRLARELIDIPSETGNEAAVTALVEERLAALGLTARRYEVSVGRWNLFASKRDRPRVVLCSHTDTVPPFIASSETEDSVFGRGACDTKGIIASMIAAAEQLLAAGTDDFAFLFVVGEETDSIGAKKANADLATLGSSFVVIGEPTESRFVRASKGALTCAVRFEGRASHSAYPERGDSAIHKLVEAVRRIEDTDWGDDPDLGRGTVNVGVVRGGKKPNIVPDEAEAEMIFRTVVPIAEVETKLRSILDATGGSIIRSHGNDPVRMVVPQGRDSIVVAFNTDAPHLSNLGRPVLFGPGSILDAHSAGEKIAKREILSAVETYRDLVKSLLEE